MTGLKVEFIDGGYEIIDNAYSYGIHAEEGTLRVAVKYEKDVVFNFECVKSIRYVDIEEADEDEEEEEEDYPEPDIENILKRLFSDGII